MGCKKGAIGFGLSNQGQVWWLKRCIWVGVALNVGGTLVFVIQTIVDQNIMSYLHDSDEEYDTRGPKKDKYHKTTMKQKEKLIDLVENQNFSIYKASKKLKMSNSTAKAVLTNYHRHGVILPRNGKTETPTTHKSPQASNEAASNANSLEEHSEARAESIESPEKESEGRKSTGFTRVESWPCPMMAQPFPFYFYVNVPPFMAAPM